jgi:hypothetical protein
MKRLISLLMLLPCVAFGQTLRPNLFTTNTSPQSQNITFSGNEQFIQPNSGYYQVWIQNTSNGVGSSGDLVIGNDLSTPGGAIDFVDLGINSSTFNTAGNIGGLGDSYLFTPNSNFWQVVGSPSGAYILQVGSTNTNAVVIKATAGNLNFPVPFTSSGGNLIYNTNGQTLFQATTSYHTNLALTIPQFGIALSCTGGGMAGWHVGDNIILSGNDQVAVTTLVNSNLVYITGSAGGAGTAHTAETNAVYTPNMIASTDTTGPTHQSFSVDSGGEVYLSDGGSTPDPFMMFSQFTTNGFGLQIRANGGAFGPYSWCLDSLGSPNGRFSQNIIQVSSAAQYNSFVINSDSSVSISSTSGTGALTNDFGSTLPVTTQLVLTGGVQIPVVPIVAGATNKPAGQFILNGASTVNVGNTLVTTNMLIKWQEYSPNGGTASGAIIPVSVTAGTGFAVKSIALDTSICKYWLVTTN